jgi:hypothetical protein
VSTGSLGTHVWLSAVVIIVVRLTGGVASLRLSKPEGGWSRRAEVFGIGTGPLTDSIGKEEIARIYAIFATPKYPFGRTRPSALALI